MNLFIYIRLLGTTFVFCIAGFDGFFAQNELSHTPITYRLQEFLGLSSAL